MARIRERIISVSPGPRRLNSLTIGVTTYLHKIALAVTYYLSPATPVLGECRKPHRHALQEREAESLSVGENAMRVKDSVTLSQAG